MLRERYNQLIDLIFNFLESRIRVFLLFIMLLLLALLSAKLVLGIAAIALLLAGDAVIESYRFFIPRIPVDIELLTFGTIFLTAHYGTTLAYLFIALGIIPMTLTRGHFHPSFLVRMLSLAVASSVLAATGYSFAAAMLAILLALAMQLLGYLAFGGSIARSIISRATNLAWNYLLLSLASPLF
ncbi:hypothetical protein HY491_01975 [Candidatus Woesearchaeota archaeon]|nr:hypothetical protein [Candidatus Woesearchaeota archaeon]